MNFQFKNNFSKGINLDLDALRLPPDAAVFIKNLTNNININQGTPGSSGSNKFVYSPLEGNQALTIGTLPSGQNYCIGFYSSEQTNEGYFFLWNSSGNHSVWVISGDTGAIRKVYENSILNFLLDPQYFISEGRCTLELRSYVDPVTQIETNYKFLIFTFNLVNQFFIEVESSIATTSFSTSYFTASAAFYDTLELIHLGVPTPVKPLDAVGNPVIGLNSPTVYVPTTADLTMQNLIIRNGWQFRVKFIDIFGRESEHGVISEQYITVIGGGCISASSGQPRCMIINFDAGNPLVNYIQIEYRKWVGNDTGGALQTNWNVYEIFSKYKNIPGVEWYNRIANPIFTTSGSGITFNASTNTIAYTFCADKNSIPIDVAETSRTEPELPLKTGTLASINERLMLGNNVRGYDNINPLEIDKVVFSAQMPTSIPCDAAPLRTIIVYAAIFNETRPAWPGGTQTGVIYWSHHKVVFGGGPGAYPSTDCGSPDNAFAYDQVFGDQTPNNSGFIGVLRGTNHRCISEQINFSNSTGIATVLGYGLDGAPAMNFTCCLHMFTFVGIPAGEYIVQIASHKSTVSDGDCPRTSTYVGGTLAVSTVNPSAFGVTLAAIAASPIKEIKVDCTAGNINLNQPTDHLFIIHDMTTVAGGVALDGYLYEKVSEDVPIEMAPSIFPFITGTADDFIGSYFTDPNGFYFCVYGGANETALAMCVDICDGAGSTAKILYGPTGHTYAAYPTSGFFRATSLGMTHGDGSNTPAGVCTGVLGNWKNRIYIEPSTGIFPDAARRVINQRIADCTDHTLGLPGISIAMTKCGSAVTNTSGFASLIAHNRYKFQDVALADTGLTGYSAVPDYSTSPNNQDLLVFLQSGNCEWTDCGTCNYFRSDVTIAYLACGAPPSGCTTLGQMGLNELASGGAGWAVGNQVTVDTGTILATIQITNVSAGVVTNYIVKTVGTGYATGTKTTTAVTGTGTGFTIDILKIVPADRTTCLADVYVKFISENIAGVQSGGIYGCGFILVDLIGRHTFVQARDGAFGFVTIPNLNDINGTFPAMALCKIRCDIDPTFIVDPTFKWLIPCISSNILFTDFFSWAADWVQMIDDSGLTNNVNPTSIRVYYLSLNEYAKNNSFATNTGWELLTTGGGPKFTPVEGDIVQFIVNGDGNWFDSVISSPVTYDKNGTFFLIDYFPELATLMNGALFRVIRPNQNTSGENLIYYEQNYAIPIVAGVPSTLGFTVPYTDSYLLERQLPTPSLKGMGGPVAPGSNLSGTPYPVQYTSTNQDDALQTDGYSTNNIGNVNGVVLFDVTDYPTSFPFLFESPSPADTWGSHLSSRGRIMVKNQYAQQQRVGTEIALSDALGSRGTFNGLSYFESSNVQVFDKNTWGDITAVLVETSIVLVICNSDHYLLRYNGSNVFVDPSTGNVLSRNAQGIFQAPERKSGTNYGCAPYNINTIRKYQGTVRWLDTSGFLVLHNFSTADSNTDEAGYLGYLLQKLAEVNFQNLDARDPKPVIYFMGGIDTKNSEYYLTVFRIPGVTSPPTQPIYINTDSEPKPAENETLVFDLKTLILKGFASFTPEYYGLMPKYYTQRQFISFKEGVPYTHHNNFLNPHVAPPLYANFYGIQCECRITSICNLDPEKVKRFFAVAVTSREGIIIANTGNTPIFFSDVIKTEKNQLSRLKKSRWSQRDGIWYAEFLCDLLTPPDPNLPTETGINVLFDGNPLQGRWISVSLVTQDLYDGEYFEVTSVTISGNGVEKSG